MSLRPADRQQRSRTVVVASSAGGLTALSVVLAAFPPDLTASVICVQHMHPHTPSYLVDILGRRCALPVAFAATGVEPCAGLVLVAPPDRHVLVEEDGRLSLWNGPPVNHVRPAADLLFSSAAAVLGEQVVAVVLSGTGHDGAAGAAAVRQRGGIVLVQSPESSQFPGMPQSAMSLVRPDAVLPAEEIGPALVRLVAGKPL
jgi:two-component system chemotaxis response regulator CheB